MLQRKNVRKQNIRSQLSAHLIVVMLSDDNNKSFLELSVLQLHLPVHDS